MFYNFRILYNFITVPLQIIGDFLKIILQVKIITLFDLSFIQNGFAEFFKLFSFIYKNFANHVLFKINLFKIYNNFNSLKEKVPLNNKNLSIKNIIIDKWNIWGKPIKFLYL